MSKTQMLSRRLSCRIAFLITIGVLFAVSVISASAQENVWTANYERKENITKNKAAGRQSFPTESSCSIWGYGYRHKNIGQGRYPRPWPLPIKR